MSEIPRQDNPARCTICDTYNLKGLWNCECGALNVSLNQLCWKCSRKRDVTSTGDDAPSSGDVRV